MIVVSVSDDRISVLGHAGYAEERKVRNKIVKAFMNLQIVWARGTHTGNISKHPIMIRRRSRLHAKRIVHLGNIAKGQKWFNTNYPNVLKSATGALLYVDNSCGSHSRWGALTVWKDLVNRKYGFSLTPSNKNFGASCKTAAKKAQIQKGVSGTLVYIVEFILSAKGYYAGKMDADFGSGLETAVKAFQKARGITANGVVGSDTWYTLFN